MGRKPEALTLPAGVTRRRDRLQIAFSWEGKQCRELMPEGPITKGALLYASNLRAEIKRKIEDGSFVYAEYFPDSPKAKAASASTPLMETALQVQLQTYQQQVDNGQMSPATLRGYAKAINGERMRRWHGRQVREVTPSDLRLWISEMDCTSKAIRNVLIPLRSVFEDALNDGLIDFNPFERIALAKLIRQTSKASDYVIQPFTAAERAQLLAACRADERPMMQFWFATGLRPGELQALEWRHIDVGRKVARIEQNQVVGVIKAPKTMAGIRDVDLSSEALAALTEQRPWSAAKGTRVWLNPRNAQPWETDAQIRKTLWMPLMARSGLPYRNPYQVRHTYASSLLTAGANPWYLAQQLGHEDVEMVFRTYGKFIGEDYQKPKAVLKAVS
ncbi:site-specific integrase [Acidovorax sp. SUPP950]|uniref:site-specific integrase n=1 Tax=Acidovorax sp. SUPP950 TaxID=511901 RepID=UPI0023D69AE7|nr:site-specific integrase [Acidovorax sp. SUPP950]GKS73728.1 site-specific integrase [Acidovorax sp. SUPP950]